MPTHLYCLLPPGSSVAAGSGIRIIDAKVALVWGGDSASGRLSRDAHEVARATVAHDRVIGAALLQGITPIPASLADPYDDDSGMLADIRSHARDIELAFPAITGMVEMTTIISLNDAPPSEKEPGRGKVYLEQIRSRPARVAAIADRIQGELGKRIADVRRRDEGGRVALSHLVPRDAVGIYRTLALGQAEAGFRLVVDGPRAPYSFALFSPHRGLITDMWLGGTILAT